jgi:hypothetical protein
MPSFYPIKSFAGVLAMILAILRTNIRSTNNYKMRSTTLKIDAYGPKTGDYSSSLRSDQHSSGVDRRRFPRTVVISSHTDEQTSLTDALYTTKNNFQIDGKTSHRPPIQSSLHQNGMNLTPLNLSEDTI